MAAIDTGRLERPAAEVLGAAPVAVWRSCGPSPKQGYAVLVPAWAHAAARARLLERFGREPTPAELAEVLIGTPGPAWLGRLAAALFS